MLARLFSKFMIKYYDNLYKLPLQRFIEFSETGNYLCFLQTWIDKITPEIEQNCKDCFLKILFQFETIDCEREKLLAEYLYNALQFEVTGKHDFKNKTFVFEKRLKAFETTVKQEKLDYSKEISILSKWLGFQIDRNKISLGDYLAHRRNYNEYCNSIKK